MARKIGFIDYRLNNFHANIYLDLLRTKLKGRGWKVGACWAMDEKEGRLWAKRKKVPFVSDLEEMRDCDGLVVLAPSNPETHWELAQLALPLGKPTYIDKTFAPDLATARRIFRLADQCGVPVITTSALRCSASLRKLADQLETEGIRHIQAWGGGRSFDEYSVHPLEMIVSVLGPEVKRVMRVGNNHFHQVQLEFSKGRTATVFVHIEAACGFSAMISSAKRTQYVCCDGDPFFEELCTLVLDFFRKGEETIDRREALAIRAIQDTMAKPACRRGFVKVAGLKT
jgi:predicted dehydrogenase